MKILNRICVFIVLYTSYLIAAEYAYDGLAGAQLLKAMFAIILGFTIYGWGTHDGR